MNTTPIFRRLLVGVDPEGLASDALIQGFSLAQALGLELHLVLAVQVPPALWPGIDENQLASMHANALASAKAKALSQLEPVLESAGIEADLEQELKVHAGHPGKVILHKAEELGADLILLGSHAKRSGLDFGSTARSVFSHAKLPVWTQGKTPVPILSILAPVDFSTHSDQAARHAQALAERLKASVHALHCFESPDHALVQGYIDLPAPSYVLDQARAAAEEHLERWMAGFPWGSVPAKASFVVGDPVASIQNAAQQHDLVVMGTQGRTGLARFLLGGVAYGVLKQATTPVLVVPSGAKSWQLEGTNA